jgi:uncharacterized protein YceH (UPF0502 family)
MGCDETPSWFDEWAQRQHDSDARARLAKLETEVVELREAIGELRRLAAAMESGEPYDQ